MKLEDRGRLIVKYLQEMGPQLGAQLCERFSISEQVLLNTMKPLREAGTIAVDKISRPGERGSPINRFRMASDEDGTDAQIVIKSRATSGVVPMITGEFNPADPFGVGARRAARSIAATAETQAEARQILQVEVPEEDIAALRRLLARIDGKES